MTTGPETIAAAIRDGFRELAEAIASRETPRMAPSAANTPDPVQVDPPEAAESLEDELGPLNCWCGARTNKRMVGRRMGRYCPRGHDVNTPPIPRPNVATVTAASMAVPAPPWLATIPRPMTVGQLTAEHIGKRVRFEGPVPLRLVRIEHCSDGVTIVYGARGDSQLDSGTPCEVLDD